MKNEGKVIRKLCTALGHPDLASNLTDSAWRDIQPILIKVMRERVLKSKSTDLLREYESRMDLYGVSKTNSCLLHTLIEHFNRVVQNKYEVVELSPISPMGLNSLLTEISQDITLSSIRQSEVVSDPTTPLALHCAHLRKKMIPNKEKIGDPVHLATSTKVLRLQKFDQSKGYLQHFKLLGLCSGGRNGKDYFFGIKYLTDHISTWLDFVQSLQENGYCFENIQVKLSDVRLIEAIIQHHKLDRDKINLHSLDDDFDLFESFGIRLPKEIPKVDSISDKMIAQNGLFDFIKNLRLLEDNMIIFLKAKYPNVTFSIDLNRKAGLGYYKDYCYHIFATNLEGREVQLADGGSTDWLTKLLSSEKEHMVTSGFGAELVHNLFNIS